MRGLRTWQEKKLMCRLAVKTFFAFFPVSVSLVFRSWESGMLNVDYHYLDLATKGQDEGDRKQFWVRRHDEYGR